jgi:membrane protease subunit (stomatin/prohibitin family)
MTIHAQSSIPLKDVKAKKRELQSLIESALDYFYEQTGLSVDCISVEAVETYPNAMPILAVKHIVSLEVKL